MWYYNCPLLPPFLVSSEFSHCALYTYAIKTGNFVQPEQLMNTMHVHIISVGLIFGQLGRALHIHDAVNHYSHVNMCMGTRLHSIDGQGRYASCLTVLAVVVVRLRIDRVRYQIRYTELALRRL